MAIISHTPTTGQHRIQYCGDTIVFKLELDAPLKGTAWLRTNIGHAKQHRQEIIEHVELQKPLLSRDWHDIPMHPCTPEQKFPIRGSALPSVVKTLQDKSPQRPATKDQRPETRDQRPETSDQEPCTLYTIEMPLSEVGRFQAKAFFIPEATNDPQWPEGNNVVIKVEPAVTVSGNSVYSAFVRQFGPNMGGNKIQPKRKQVLDELDSDGYTVIPKSGTFRTLIAELDHIINNMGFGIIQLLPIHPVPTTYARMGRFGSPFASMDFFDVDPALAEFDRKTTPLDQFSELVDAIHARNASIFLDMPINHTGWASHLQMHHPEWFARNHDSSFASPGAWGTIWEDLSELDYNHCELWQYMADVFIFWCRRGVNGFRCDAGYMVPLPVWEYITAKVRQEFPNTIFLLEGLGGDIKITQNLLDRANLNWAYSEMFQTDDRNQFESYLPHCRHITTNQGTMIHFAETHDNNRLAAKSPAYSRMRTALAALLSEAGAFGITNGVEWFATAKVDVHSAAPLNWGADDNQIKEIAQLNNLLNNHPAFTRGVSQKQIQIGAGNAIAILRSPKNNTPILIIANLDDKHPTTISWKSTDFDTQIAHDLLTNTEQTINNHTIQLAPAQILCLSHTTHPCSVGSQSQSSEPQRARQTNDQRPTTRDQRPETSDQSPHQPSTINHQLIQATALSLYTQLTTHKSLHTHTAEDLAQQLTANPEEFCQNITNAPLTKSITTWQYPQDLNRNVMLPHNHTLLLKSPAPFHATLAPCNPSTLQPCNLAIANSIQTDNGQHIAFLTPPPTKEITPLTLHIACSVGPAKREDKSSEPLASATSDHRPETSDQSPETIDHRPATIDHQASPILQLSSGTNATVTTKLDRKTIHNANHYALLTNNRGAISQVQLEWGNIQSQYDCLLGANLNDQVPVDRHIAFTRCRAWLTHRDYSQAITTDCIQNVTINPNNSITWLFVVPVGMGKSITLKVTLQLTQNENRVDLSFERISCKGSGCDLDPTDPITLLLRPDIEDRNFHETTKAHSGPEHNWPKAVNPRESGFSFSPSNDRTLDINIPSSTFIHEAEWTYDIPHPFEAQRGLNNSGDLFSPGYFQTNLKSGQTTTLTATLRSPSCPIKGRAQISEQATASFSEPDPTINQRPETSNQKTKDQESSTLPLSSAMKQGMQAFIVKRDQTRTVIAGYPWFLDWGRDTLICLRGIISAGMHEEAKDILIQFAGLESQGTLPNMIRGNDDSNRDTSDAPLWFFTACADLIQQETQQSCSVGSTRQNSEPQASATRDKRPETKDQKTSNQRPETRRPEDQRPATRDQKTRRPATSDQRPETNDFLDQTCKGRTIRQILTSIANHYINGTPNGIKMDPETALIFSPSHYTWMDTNHPAGTPREGYPIEIQALWFAALKLMAEIEPSPHQNISNPEQKQHSPHPPINHQPSTINSPHPPINHQPSIINSPHPPINHQQSTINSPHPPWQELANQVQQSIKDLYTLPDRDYLADCLLASPGIPAKQATPDNALRPNQLFAITLGAITDTKTAQGILTATEKLLIPGAIRSLADQPVSPPLPVYRDGQLLNDPENPYWGSYAGDEDTRRKPAYHNGTAWTWPFPSYCEALYMTGGMPLHETALSILSSSTILSNNGCIGHIPEILDADAPHHQRGCGAQAWGDTELYRVLKLLE